MISRIAHAIRKNAIPIAIIILAIAAIWYCFKISTFSSLSEEKARFWLGFNEELLIAASLLLFVGLFGEWPDSEEWKKRPWYKAAKMAVILGVLGEVLGDAGIFESEGTLQERQTATIRTQNNEIIALLRHGIARSIDVAKFKDRLLKAPPSKAEIRYVMDCSDCEFLSVLLADAIQKGGWSVAPLIRIEDHDWVRAVHLLHARPIGITVVFDSPDKITGDPKTPLGALMGAISQALGFSFGGYDADNSGAVDATVPPDVFRIVVAPKA